MTRACPGCGPTCCLCGKPVCLEVNPEALDDATGDARCEDHREAVYGHCTACRSIEVRLNKATGTRDLSSIGESAAYPTGYGCELCA